MLKHIFKKLINNEKITIAYFGGSITQGAGSSNWSKTCWRALVTEWFKNTYPNSEIEEINATIGGTGSDFGVFRIDKDVLSFNPDLVFIEFCTNDTAINNCLIFEETLIRKIIENNPETDIVLVRTMTKNMCYKLLNIPPHESYISYEKLSKYYDIPMIDVGAEFRKRMANSIENIDKYTTDGVHPNDYGYSIIANKVISFLTSNLNLKPFITSNDYMNAKMVTAKNISNTNLELLDVSYYKDYGALCGSTDDKYVKFSFYGTEVGIFARFAKNTGMISWSIDDSKPQICNLFDEYALKFDRNSYIILKKDMKLKEHTLLIKVLNKKDERSLGNFFILNGIFYK